MVVNPITLTPKIAEVNGAKPTEIDNEFAIADKVSISSKAREIQHERVEVKDLAKKIMAASPDIRQEKVSESLQRLNKNSLQEKEIINTVAERISKMIGIS